MGMRCLSITRMRANCLLWRNTRKRVGVSTRDLAEEFCQIPAIDHLSEESKSLIKFHGKYQQEDRGRPEEPEQGRRGQSLHVHGSGSLKMLGGKRSADQYLALDDIVGEYANGTLRLNDAPKHSVPRRPQAEHEEHDGGDKRFARHDAGGLRGYQSNMPLPPKGRYLIPFAGR